MMSRSPLLIAAFSAFGSVKLLKVTSSNFVGVPQYDPARLRVTNSFWCHSFISKGPEPAGCLSMSLILVGS